MYRSDNTASAYYSDARVSKGHRTPIVEVGGEVAPMTGECETKIPTNEMHTLGEEDMFSSHARSVFSIADDLFMHH